MIQTLRLQPKITWSERDLYYLFILLIQSPTLNALSFHFHPPCLVRHSQKGEIDLLHYVQNNVLDTSVPWWLSNHWASQLFGLQYRIIKRLKWIWPKNCIAATYILIVSLSNTTWDGSRVLNPRDILSPTPTQTKRYSSSRCEHITYSIINPQTPSKAVNCSSRQNFILIFEILSNIKCMSDSARGLFNYSSNSLTTNLTYFQDTTRWRKGTADWDTDTDSDLKGKDKHSKICQPILGIRI